MVARTIHIYEYLHNYIDGTCYIFIIFSSIRSLYLDLDIHSENSLNYH